MLTRFLLLGGWLLFLMVTKLGLLVGDAPLQLLDIFLLVACKLGKGRGSYVKFQKDAVFAISRQVAISFKQLDSIESVVAPAFPHFKLASKFTNNFLVAITLLRDHFNSVLIFLGLVLLGLLIDKLGRWRNDWALVHLQEHRYIISVGSRAISVRINFQTPWDSIGH